MDGLLRNRLLELLTADVPGRVLFAVGLAATTLSVMATTARSSRAGKLIYPYWFLQLVPVLLVEPRYYFSTYLLVSAAAHGEESLDRTRPLALVRAAERLAPHRHHREPLHAVSCMASPDGVRS